MTNKTINDGGDFLLLTKDGYLQTKTASNTYKLKKAVDIDYDLAPPYELKYSADMDFDPTPVGDIGTWATSFPLTTNMITAKSDLSNANDDDKQTVSYWMLELAQKRYPPISFREVMADTQSPVKSSQLNWEGILTRVRKTRTETEGTFNILLEGLVKQHVNLVQQ